VTSALFLRGSNSRFSFTSVQFVGLCICVLSLATSRLIFAPLTVLPALLRYTRRSSHYVASSAICITLSLLWIIVASVSVAGMPPRELTTTRVALFYVQHPGAMLHVVLNTLVSVSLLRFYWESFVGVLGWLDTPLAGYAYTTFGVIFATLLVFSCRGVPSLSDSGRLALGCGALLSLGAMFVIELLVWTPLPAETIEGIQGRYFTPILILFGYSILPHRTPFFRPGTTVTFLLIVISFSVTCMVPAILHRYWLQ
jgi:uncharacterized membrane protein